ncbi:MAG: c-type cytochrome, partial [Nitrospinaceae bacterium]|nr:c-type cytochrome [Nitrospinaceae bacterium]NIR57797.1 c-type cytochrome [Nitrospinaceae bacterium]NIS88256.1 c-type cytochrome [Nitrospinaceae bacterium]NIT85137.1 c-type cytochrome [Nitrospinaceae bacterium]NIU47293.1 c-type cytochrome [Nitrospinaceae bacterium]
PEAYAFWRVMKGGPGLPQKFEPWNSAMPAWEEQLDEDQVWKVLLYITATLVQRFPAVPDPEPVTPSVKLGEKLYQENCAYCHGESGDGQGPAAEFSSPQPRNFNKGQYKIRSTPFGKIPTDQDLFDMITHGMPTTSMPPWKHLSEVERWSLVKYLKTLSTKFEKFIKRNKTHKIVKVPSPPAFSLESVERGKDLYLQNCSNCHGREGRGDGSSTYKIVNIEKDQIFPRNLTQSWKFRRGDKRKDLYLTLRTGLSGTAMPRFSPRIFKDQQIWDMVHYVQTLSPSVQPPMHPVIQVKKIEGPVPGSPEDPLWKTLDAYPFPLGGQLMVSDKAYHPIVERVVVKAAHNGEEIAFYLQWDDPSHDPALASATKVTVSPPPPLPPHLRVAGGVKDERIDIP